MAVVEMTVNGRPISASVEAWTLLVEFLRRTLGLTGTHIGCDTSQCGACIVHLNGKPVKSCTTLAVSCAHCEITTIEGLARGYELHPMQAAFAAHHALQCGFCTPGMIMTAIDIVERHGPDLAEEVVRAELDGNLCRCTGYQNIVDAIMSCARNAPPTPARQPAPAHQSQ